MLFFYLIPGFFALNLYDVNWCSDIVNNSEYDFLKLQTVTSDNMELLYTYTFTNDFSYQYNNDGTLKNESEYANYVDTNHRLDGGLVTDKYIVLAFPNYQENMTDIQFIDKNNFSNDIYKVYAIAYNKNSREYYLVNNSFNTAAGDFNKNGKVKMNDVMLLVREINN